LFKGDRFEIFDFIQEIHFIKQGKRNIQYNYNHIKNMIERSFIVVLKLRFGENQI